MALYMPSVISSSPVAFVGLPPGPVMIVEIGSHVGANNFGLAMATQLTPEKMKQQVRDHFEDFVNRHSKV